MNVSSASLTDIIKFFESVSHPEHTLTELVLMELDTKNALKLGIGYETFLAKKHSKEAIRMMNEYQALYDYEANVGI